MVRAALASRLYAAAASRLSTPLLPSLFRQSHWSRNVGHRHLSLTQIAVHRKFERCTRVTGKRHMGGGVHVWHDENGNEFYMNPLEAEERIMFIMKNFEKLNPVDVKKDSNFAELGLDSFDTVELLMAIEEEFDIEMLDAEADRLTSVPEVVDYLINHPYVKSYA
eukprot:Plantae.Rhodophyta-Purpureofilum_apyrenoidigerum.ctg3418.p1 GENE.Plantae.Rhodophyta-Purpureofilum_apyrenoidigerum.ctg3418~~Plantae.Rhodophyta-Purpureofilum_apyrenoidigerum.ctg3418.p1  ORF type:complete len:165 (-),score=23.28 Plantae.Rhodophyta-Purpureofilum_apyrenoidigerum.ctg3418:91-585(-)